MTVTIKKDVPFTALPDADTYAPITGLSDSLPAARDPKHNRAWLTHCYGMVGVGRDNDADSGGGTDLYVVIGHAPRNLDRNVTLVGRVMQGIELLSTLPRGTGQLGFYEKPEQMVPIKTIRLAADVPESSGTLASGNHPHRHADLQVPWSKRLAFPRWRLVQEFARSR